MELNSEKALVILNASAGIGNAQVAEKDIVEAFTSAGYEVSVSKIMPGADVISGAGFPDGSGIVVCCGGDGTFNQITNRYLGTESVPKFAYIPCGNTNSFARSLGISEDAGEAIEAAVRGEIYRCDAGRVNESFFNYVASFGSASTLNFVTSQQMKNVFGCSKHILMAIGELHMNMGNGFHMAIETDAGLLEDEYIFGAVSNLSGIDGAFFGDNTLRNNDGVMNLLLIKKPESRTKAKEALNILREGGVDHPLIQIARITEGCFISDSDIVWSFDGEYGGIQKEARLEVLKEALPVLIP